MRARGYVSAEFNHLANFNSVMVIVHHSASDKLAVDSLVCMVKLACLWTETLYSPKESCVWQIVANQRFVNDKLVFGKF